MRNLLVKTLPRAAFKQPQRLPEWTPELARKTRASATAASPPAAAARVTLPIGEIPPSPDAAGLRLHAGAPQP